MYRQSTHNVLWFVPKLFRKKQYNYLVSKFQLKQENPSLNSFNISRFGFFYRFFKKISFIFSRNKANQEFSKESLNTVNYQQTNEYGEIESCSELSEKKLQSVSNDIEDPELKIEEIQENPLFLEITCSICLNGILDTESVINENLESEYSNTIFREYSQKYNMNHIMKTPCNHLFHIGKSFFIF